MKKKLSLLVIISLLCISVAFGASAKKTRAQFVESAKVYMGVPYRSGGVSTKGMDCSGFVYAAAKDIGLDIPRSAVGIYQLAQKISDSELEPGDLVFFSVGSEITHVGIYVGDNSMINSASEGRRTGVIISSLSENYWKTHYAGAGRIILDPEKKSYVCFNYGALFDWTFVTSEKEIAFIPRGGTLQAELQLSAFKFNPGIMARYTYSLNDYSSFKFNSLINSFNIPVCLTLHFNDYVSLYTGVVLSTGKVCSENQILYKTDKEIVPVFYPGIFGITLQTPKFTSKNISLVQDISFTCYEAAGETSKLSQFEWLAAGLKCSTGINLSLPF